MKPVMLMILDGWGYRSEKSGNAIELANAPNYHALLKKWPNILLNASGLSVGLPEGTMGNSEVGHLNLGAGRVVYQEFTRINKSIEEKTFFQNEVLKKTFTELKVSGGALHLMGLCSDIGVHSHLNHLYALVDFASQSGIKNIFVHCFTDGRDSPPDSGLGYIKAVEENIRGKAKIATVMGRYWGMDRDKRWDRVEKAYNALVDGVGLKESSAVETVEKSYKAGKTDEFIEPTVICDGASPIAKINDDDSVIFFNFRADRAREMTRAMTDASFNEFKRRVPKLTSFVMMTRYEESFALPVIFPPERLTNILGEVLSKSGKKQLRIAETEKYAHVTYFFNGGEEKVFDGEDRALIPSPRDVPTYDKKPEMSALQVTEEVLKRIDSDNYDVIILNYANPDMVGHTGVLAAAIKAVETVDGCLQRVIDAVLKKNGVVLLTADHGNCEEMIDERGEPQTAHTTDLVPFVVIGNGLESAKLTRTGALCDIAPTILKLIGVKSPAEMTGHCLIES